MSSDEVFNRTKPVTSTDAGTFIIPAANVDGPGEGSSMGGIYDPSAYPVASKPKTRTLEQHLAIRAMHRMLDATAPAKEIVHGSRGPRR